VRGQIAKSRILPPPRWEKVPIYVMTNLAAAFAIGGASDELCPGKGRIHPHKGVVFSRGIVPPDEPGGIG
jgi:hypothetical protein